MMEDRWYSRSDSRTDCDTVSRQTDGWSKVFLPTSGSNYPLDSSRSPSACLVALVVWLIVVYGVIKRSLMAAQRNPETEVD